MLEGRYYERNHRLRYYWRHANNIIIEIYTRVNFKVALFISGGASHIFKPAPQFGKLWQVR